MHPVGVVFLEASLWATAETAVSNRSRPPGEFKPRSEQCGTFPGMMYRSRSIPARFHPSRAATPSSSTISRFGHNPTNSVVHWVPRARSAGVEPPFVTPETGKGTTFQCTTSEDEMPAREYASRQLRAVRSLLSRLSRPDPVPASAFVDGLSSRTRTRASIPPWSGST